MQSKDPVLEELFYGFLTCGTRKQMIIQLEQFIKRHYEKDYISQYLYACFELLTNNPDAAIKTLKELEEHAEYTQIKPYICIVQGLARTQRAVGNILAIKPDDNSKKHFKDAQISFNRAIDLNKHLPKGQSAARAYALMGLGDCYLQVAEYFKITGSSHADSERLLYEKALENLNDALDEFVFPRDCPMLLNDKGDVLMQLRRHKEAVETYGKAIEQCPTCPYPHNGMGRALIATMDFKEAIVYFEKAVLLDKRFDFPKIGKADCLLILGSFKEAEQIYLEVLNAIEDKQSPRLQDRKLMTYAHLGLGRVYYELGKAENPTKYFIKSLDQYQLALENGPGFAYTFMHLGRLLSKSRSTAVKELFNSRQGTPKLSPEDQAIKMFKEAINRFNSRGDLNNIKDAKNHIKELRKVKTIKKQSLKEDARNRNEFSVLDRMLSEIEMKAFAHQKKHFYDFLSEKPFSKGSTVSFTFEVLRRWNSYTPLISNSNGGGYFIRFNGIGLVVDPGYGFINNFRLSGHHFHEINSIFISHAHDDHTADVEPIINLMYRYNKNLEEEYIPLRYSRGNQISKYQIMRFHKYYQKQKSLTRDDHHKIGEKIEKEFLSQRMVLDLYCCEEVKIKFEGIFKLNLLIDENGDFIIDDPGSSTTSANRYVRVNWHEVDGNKTHSLKKKQLVPIKTRHNVFSQYEELKAISGKINYGFYIVSDKTSLIYTSDTAWDQHIDDVYKDVRDATAGTYRILVSHFGAFKQEELNYVNKRTFKAPFYKNHLGALGLSQINHLLNPQICILSEFGEEYYGLRAKIAEIYNDVFKNTVKFIPGDIGLKLVMDYEGTDDPVRFEAITYIDHVGKEVIYDLIKPAELDFHEIETTNSIVYYKNSLDIADIIQAMLENYMSIRAGQAQPMLI